jgi:hypothetical protein
LAQNNSLSPEDIAKLSKTIAEAKSLMDRELEIVKQVLEYEEQIGKIKIGYLKDADETLQRIATKESQVGESFLLYQSKVDKYEKDQKKAKGKKSSKKSGSSDDIEVKDVKNRSSDSENYNMNRNKPEKVELRGPTAAEIKKAAKAREKAESRIADMRKLDRLNSQQERDRELRQYKEWETELSIMRVTRQKELGKKAEELFKTEMKLQALKHESEEDHQDRILAISIANRKKVADMEFEAQESLLKMQAQMDYYTDPKYAEEITALSNQETTAKYDKEDALKKEDAFLKRKAQLELYYKRKNNGILSKDDAKKMQKFLADEFNTKKKNEAAIAKHRADLVAIESEKANAQEDAATREQIGALTKTGASIAERKAALYELTRDSDGNFNQAKALKAAVLAVSDLAKHLEDKIDTIAGKKGVIDTRLQGSNNKTTILGSYWDKLTKDMISVGAATPFFKQENFASNIESLVNKGISFDLKQRAFLMTIQEKIATTFDVADGTLLRLVRIQQEDSTAGRLGMESALNAFLNEMYETSEYLSDVASSVRGSLQEMEALMSGAEATEVEYQVQKWLGSLYSVGMSQEATRSIADALGKIASGDVDGLTNGGAGNLLIMAANDAGLSIADILTDGINSSDTNKLLQAAVNYLSELSDSAEDNKVVQQQLANVFGVKASDLRAATNLTTDDTLKNVYGESMTYDNMLSQLYKMAATMGSRTSMGEMMSNVWNNVQYTLAGSMASNPVSYMVYKMAGLLESTTGGIDIGLPMVMGNGMPVQFKISDLMRAASMAGSVFLTLPQILNGLVAGSNGALMLASMGIDMGSGLKATPRGSGGSGKNTGGGQRDTSDSGYVGNGTASDIKDSTIQENEDSVKKQMIEAQEEAEANQIDLLNQTVVKIYELLDEVASGKSTFSVKVDGYGLTKAGSGGAQGGVAALNSGNNSNGNSAIRSSATSGNVSFSGWTTL